MEAIKVPNVYFSPQHFPSRQIQQTAVTLDDFESKMVGIQKCGSAICAADRIYCSSGDPLGMVQIRLEGFQLFLNKLNSF